MPARTWILTGSPENFAATRAHEFTVIGLKERRRRQALEMETGDRIVFYLTRVMAFAASARIVGELYEDRTPIWPGKPGRNSRCIGASTKSAFSRQFSDPFFRKTSSSTNTSKERGH